MPDALHGQSEHVAEAWRDGYDAAVSLVRISGHQLGSQQIAGLARTLDTVRDEMQEKWERTTWDDRLTHSQNVGEEPPL